MSYKPIDRSLKTAAVAGSKSTENNVTLTPFVVNLSYPRLSNYYIMCEIDAGEGADSFCVNMLILWAMNREPHRDTSVQSETCIPNVYAVHSRQLIRQPSACECRSRVAQYSSDACRGQLPPLRIGQLSVCSLHQIRRRVPVPHYLPSPMGSVGNRSDTMMKRTNVQLSRRAEFKYIASHSGMNR